MKNNWHNLGVDTAYFLPSDSITKTNPMNEQLKEKLIKEFNEIVDWSSIPKTHDKLLAFLEQAIERSYKEGYEMGKASYTMGKEVDKEIWGGDLEGRNWI